MWRAASASELIELEAAALADDDRPRALRALNAREHADKVGLSVAVEPGDAENLAAMKPKVDFAAARPDLHRVGLQNDVATQRILRCQAPASSGPSDFARHQPQQIGFGNVALFQNADVAPVAQHGHPIGDAHHFGDAVRHDQDAGAGVAQFADLGEQPFGRTRGRAPRRIRRG